MKDRHAFAVRPERAEAWLTHMRETMMGMELDPDIRGALFAKIQALAEKKAVQR